MLTDTQDPVGADDSKNRGRQSEGGNGLRPDMINSVVKELEQESLT